MKYIFKLQSSVTILKNAGIKTSVNMKFQYLYPGFMKLKIIF